jgi:hypothetical protein
MIALDTNILARFYVDDPGDPEAAKQRPIARQILTESVSLFVPLTVVLELNGSCGPSTAFRLNRSCASSSTCSD